MKPVAKIAPTAPTQNLVMNPEDILTPQQLAARLQVNVSWVYDKTRRRSAGNGEPMPVLNSGRYLRFYWPDICAWLRNGDNPRRRSRS
jgi:predicted DNA-binding transcriptional regulator AlpA